MLLLLVLLKDPNIVAPVKKYVLKKVLVFPTDGVETSMGPDENAADKLYIGGF
jgi:hypothetical protein